MDEKRLGAFCRENGIRKLAFFEWALRGELRAESDLDLLVELETAREPGLLGLARIERELSVLFHRKVDLRTAEDLSRYFRSDVLATARVQYAA